MQITSTFPLYDDTKHGRIWVYASACIFSPATPPFHNDPSRFSSQRMCVCWEKNALGGKTGWDIMKRGCSRTENTRRCINPYSTQNFIRNYISGLHFSYFRLALPLGKIRLGTIKNSII